MIYFSFPINQATFEQTIIEAFGLQSPYRWPGTCIIHLLAVVALIIPDLKPSLRFNLKDAPPLSVNVQHRLRERIFFSHHGFYLASIWVYSKDFILFSFIISTVYSINLLPIIFPPSGMPTGQPTSYPSGFISTQPYVWVSTSTGA